MKQRDNQEPQADEGALARRYVVGAAFPDILQSLEALYPELSLAAAPPPEPQPTEPVAPGTTENVAAIASNLIQPALSEIDQLRQRIDALTTAA